MILYSPTSIIRTRDAKKIQGQSTHCACAVNLRHVVAAQEPAAALLFNQVLSLKEVKKNAWLAFYQSRMGLKSSKCSINLSIIRFCMHNRSSGCGLGVVNVIRTVPNFPLAKGVRIIEVGLYYGRHTGIASCIR